MQKLAELAKLFLKLGTISFGGPAAHIAIMEHEVVTRRGWLSGNQFLDLISVTNLIPGPNAVEMANHVGYRRAGLLGSIVAGTCFTLPAVLITAVCAFVYQRYGTLPEVKPFLDGIKPVVLAIVFAAVCRLGYRAFRGWQLLLIGTGVAGASLAGCDTIATLLIGSLLGVLLLRITRRSKPPSGKSGLVSAGVISVGTARAAQAASVPLAIGTATAAAVSTSVPLWKLGLFFLKISVVLYGGGYVLLAYMEGELVGDYGWLTEQQLLDAVAIGQLTPGPLLSTATFVGYLVAGWPGAAVATLGLLLPSFVLVAAVNPLIPRLRQSVWASRFLDAVGAASIGLMAAVTITLSRATLVDWPAWLLALVAAALALRWKIAPGWLVLAGAVLGRLLYGIS